MKVILLQNIENLGEKDQIKEVADGYAKNFLFPKKLAKLVDKNELKELEIRKELESKNAEQELKQVQDVVSKIDGFEISIFMKIGKDDKIFGSVTAGKIVEKLKDKGFNIKKTQIELQNPIKEIGEWPVKISFAHGLEAEIRVIILDEEKDINIDIDEEK
ncbi:MAG: 50S ribosomal protein L9 [Candidatus Pacebacteria bacterium]|nr:50S ribosomal protein L9 [Candidatus Paceibacterota bacterium]